MDRTRFYFIKSELHCGRFTALRKSLILLVKSRQSILNNRDQSLPYCKPYVHATSVQSVAQNNSCEQRILSDIYDFLIIMSLPRRGSLPFFYYYFILIHYLFSITRSCKINLHRASIKYDTLK